MVSVKEMGYRYIDTSLNDVIRSLAGPKITCFCHMISDMEFQNRQKYDLFEFNSCLLYADHSLDSNPSTSV